MIRFPIDLKIVKFSSEFFLNDSWSLVCNGKIETNDLYFNIHLIRHGVASSEDILVSGEISNAENQLDKKIFSNYRSSSFQSMHLAKLSFGDASDLGSKKVCLLGYIIIASNCVNCASLSQIEESGFNPKSLVQLSNDFERLLNSETPCFSDVTLTCGSYSMPAHKSILCVRSPYFSSLFKHLVKENSKYPVNLTGIDSPAFFSLMMYIYSGKTLNLTVELASDLLPAADKYELQDLKEVCCDFLKKNITSDNVLSILVLGDTLDEGLKSFCVDYIRNFEDLSAFESRKEWETLRVDQPDLADDVLSSLKKSKEIK